MEIINQILSVLLVLALLGGTLWWLKRKSLVRFGLPNRAKGGGARLEAVERLPLTAQHTLHLVRVADRAVLLAVHGAGCTVIERGSWDDVAGDRRAGDMDISEVGR